MEFSGLQEIMMLRMFERMLSVLIGGLSIYFGYRLFLLLPTQSNSSGKIELPGFSVVLAKAGPGLFFAAFGSIFLYQSLTNPIDVNFAKKQFIGAMQVQPIKNRTGPPENKTLDQNFSLQKIERVRQAVQMLNCMALVATQGEKTILPEDVEEPVRDAKVALIETIWDKAAWGDKKTFREWSTIEEGKLPSDLRKLYFEELPGCPD